MLPVVMLLLLFWMVPTWAAEFYYSCQQPNGTMLLQDHPGPGCTRYEMAPPRESEPSRSGAPAPPTQSDEPNPKAPLVQIESLRCLYDYGWVRVRGELRNTSDQVLRFLKVVAILRDKNGGLLRSNGSYAQVDLIRPGESSPYDITIHYIGFFHTCEVMAGGDVMTGSSAN